MNIGSSTISCGVHTLYGLNTWTPAMMYYNLHPKGKNGVRCPHCTGGLVPKDPKRPLDSYMNARYCGECKGSGFSVKPISGSMLKKNWTYLFSDNDRGNGQKIADFIKEHKLGTIVETPEWHPNPNMSGATKIKVWVWICNGELPKLPQEELDAAQ